MSLQEKGTASPAWAAITQRLVATRGCHTQHGGTSARCMEPTGHNRMPSAPKPHSPDPWVGRSNTTHALRHVPCTSPLVTHGSLSMHKMQLWPRPPLPLGVMGVLSTGSSSATPLTRGSLAAASTLSLPPREWPASSTPERASTWGRMRGSDVTVSMIALHEIWGRG